MSLAGFLLVLAAAFCHATWNVCVKRIGGGPELIWLFSLLSALIYLPLAIGIFLVQRPHFEPVALAFIAGSAVLHLAYFLVLQTGYRAGDLSLVYPVARATGPLLSTLFAVLFLQEVITPGMATGALVILFGVFMLSGGIRQRARHVAASLGFGLGAGALIGSYTVWDAYTVSILLVSPLLLDYFSILTRLVVLAPSALSHSERLRAQWRNHKLDVVVIAVFNPLAYILVLYALTFTPVTYVAPIRETSVLLTVLAGSLILKEGDLKRRMGWSILILAGVALLLSS